MQAKAPEGLVDPILGDALERLAVQAAASRHIHEAVARLYESGGALAVAARSDRDHRRLVLLALQPSTPRLVLAASAGDDAGAMVSARRDLSD